MRTTPYRPDPAILQLADQTRRGRPVGVQDVTGANVLAIAPRSGEHITDIAYNDNADQPVTCTVPTYRGWRRYRARGCARCEA